MTKRQDDGNIDSRHQEGRDELLTWRQRAIEHLAKVGGATTARDLADATGVALHASVYRIRRFPRYFLEESRQAHWKGRVDLVRLHPHLAAHMVAK
jgi:hypothetical protein